MRARLIADLAWRQRRLAGLWTVTVAILWYVWWTVLAADDLLQIFGYSMGMTFMLGPLSLRYAPRAVWYMPLPRRDIWRAFWWASTAGCALASAAKLVALLAGGRLESGFGALTVSSVYDFAYCGIGCAIAAVATRQHPAGGPGRQISIVLAGMADFVLPLGAAVFAALPMLRGVVPTHWSEFSAVTGVALAAALIVTAAGYFHVPVPARVVSSGVRGRAAGGRRRSVIGGLSGLPRLLVHEYVFTLAVGTGITVALTGVLLIAAHASSFAEHVAFLQLEMGRLDSRNLSPEEGAGPFLMFGLMAAFSASLAARYPAMMRHLRVLPLGSARLQTLLAVWPAVIWLHAWIAYIAVHYLLFGTLVQSIHLAAFVGLAGLSALVVASSLYQGASWHSLVFYALMAAVPMLFLMGFPPPSASLAFGVAALAVAVAMNRAALRRNATYRHSGLPFAIPLVR